MAYLRFYSHIFNFYRYNKNVTRCHLTRYFHIQRTMYCKYLSFLVHFLVVYLLFKSFHIFQQIVQHLMHYLYPYCEIHPSNLIYRCRISHFRIISCFFQGFNDLIFMFCTECFHCDRKFYRTISVDGLSGRNTDTVKIRSLMINQCCTKDAIVMTSIFPPLMIETTFLFLTSRCFNAAIVSNPEFSANIL